jgi:hypothetical protein
MKPHVVGVPNGTRNVTVKSPLVTLILEWYLIDTQIARIVVGICPSAESVMQKTTINTSTENTTIMNEINL